MNIFLVEICDLGNDIQLLLRLKFVMVLLCVERSSLFVHIPYIYGCRSYRIIIVLTESGQQSARDLLASEEHRHC